PFHEAGKSLVFVDTRRRAVGDGNKADRERRLAGHVSRVIISTPAPSARGTIHAMRAAVLRWRARYVPGRSVREISRGRAPDNRWRDDRARRLRSAADRASARSRAGVLLLHAGRGPIRRDGGESAADRPRA